jgi:2-C-methyl-D-erythritol 4-phosphate cytidylyltransferase
MSLPPADLPEDVPPALGAVVDDGRGSLPYALIHGEALVAVAAWAMGEAGVRLVDTGTPWDALVAAAEPLALHDPLCPMTPPDFIAACVVRAVDADCVVAGVRPVTDTVKAVEDGVVGDTVDRDGLVVVASPVVLPATVVAGLAGPPTTDFAALVGDLRRRGEVPVELLEAPPAARRIGSADDLPLLEALTSGGRPAPGPRGR